MHFRTDLLISPSRFYKKDTGTFAGPALNLLVTTGKWAIFTMLILAHEHVLPCHLCFLKKFFHWCFIFFSMQIKDCFLPFQTVCYLYTETLVVSVCLLLVCRNASDFCVLVLNHATLLL